MTSLVWVIPCFNEAKRLDPHRFLEFAKQTGARLLFVDDGSTDDTLTALETLRVALPAQIEVLPLPRNLGKAEAVRQGLLRALSGETLVVGFADADLATPPAELARLVQELEAHHADAAIGARVRLSGSAIDRSAHRHYLGRLFATFASLVLRAAIYDTQCGAKLFRRSPALVKALSEPFLSRWVFDVELLGRLAASSDAPLNLHEVPLREWADVRGSKVGPRDFLRAAADLMRIESDLSARRAARRA